MKEFLLIAILWGVKVEIDFDTMGACDAARHHMITSWGITKKESQPICISRK